MNNYNIRIYNGSDAKVYDEIFEANNENEALKKMLDKIIICDGDTIKIDLV